jgi:acyl-CoA synthetase (AMP-forming)/AMP-acid ligase II
VFAVGEGLELNARRYPDKPAVIAGDLCLSFREFDARVNRTARALQALGLRRGDHVAALLPNGVPMAEFLLATAKAGLVAVPVNGRLAPPEIAYVLSHSDARLLVAEGDTLGRMAEAAAPPLAGVRPVAVGDSAPPGVPRLDELAAEQDGSALGEPPEGTDPWLLVYTSGTTGHPKGALRSHQSNVLLALTFASDFGITADDTGLALMPMFHVNSIWFLSLSLYLGATCVLYTGRAFHPVHVLEQMAARRVTYSIFVPTMLSYLVEGAAQFDLSALRVILSSSAPLAVDLRDRVLAAFPAAHLYEIYGSTEAGAVTNTRHAPGSPAGSIGFPGLAQQVRLLGPDGAPVAPGEVGELYSRGPTLMDGYYKAPEATAAAMRDGFLSVGDLARQDRDGRLYLVDRKADMIIVSGENVYPTEVEEVLLAHPAVMHAAVVGAEDRRRGEVVHALLTLRPGAQPPTDEELLTLCRERLADYKCPRAFRIVPELPLGPTGKVVRRLARQLLDREPAS